MSSERDSIIAYAWWGKDSTQRTGEGHSRQVDLNLACLTPTSTPAPTQSRRKKENKGTREAHSLFGRERQEYMKAGGTSPAQGDTRTQEPLYGPPCPLGFLELLGRSPKIASPPPSKPISLPSDWQKPKISVCSGSILGLGRSYFSFRASEIVFA